MMVPSHKNRRISSQIYRFTWSLVFCYCVKRLPQFCISSHSSFLMDYRLDTHHRLYQKIDLIFIQIPVVKIISMNYEVIWRLVFLNPFVQNKTFSVCNCLRNLIVWTVGIWIANFYLFVIQMVHYSDDRDRASD